MASSFISRGVLEMINVIKEVEKEEEAVEKIERAIEIVNDIGDIDIPMGDNITSALDYDIDTDEIDNALETAENAVMRAAANVTEFIREGWEALAYTDSGDTEGGDKDGNEGLVFDHLLNIHAPCVIKGSALLVILLFVALLVKGCCSCGPFKSVKRWYKRRAEKKKAKREAAANAATYNHRYADRYTRRPEQVYSVQAATQHGQLTTGMPAANYTPRVQDRGGQDVRINMESGQAYFAPPQQQPRNRAMSVGTTHGANTIRKSRAGTVDEHKPERWETKAIINADADEY